MICAHGPANAKICVLLDYPENDELIRRESGAGYTGLYLKNIFDGYGIDKVYQTHLIKEAFLPSSISKKEYLEFRANIPAKYTEILTNELNTIRPNVIVPMGELALYYLTGQSKYRQLRGSILNLNGARRNELTNNNCKIVPILHPRDIRKEYKAIHYTKADAQKAIKYKDSLYPYVEDYKTWVCRSLQAFRNFKDRTLVNSEFTVVDIETYLGFITTIGFCGDGIEACSIPLNETTHMNNSEKSLLLYDIAEFLDSGVKIVNQNLRFDSKYLLRYGFNIRNHYADTMHLFACLYPDLPKNLGFQVSLFTEMQYFKDEGKEWDPEYAQKDQLYHYNAKDCIGTWRCFKRELSEASELGVKSFYFNFVHKCYFLYSHIEENGLYRDEACRLKKIAKYEEQKQIEYEILRTSIGHELNVNSPKQIAELLYRELQLPEQKERAPNGGIKLKTDETTVDLLKLNYVKDPVIINILDRIILIKKLHRILKFLNAIIYPDGYLRTRYNESGTTSGRSSTNMCDDYFYRSLPKGIKAEKYGWAFQTLPKHGFELSDGTTIGHDLREIFIPTPGYVFCDNDQKAAEAVVVARLANDEELMARIKSNTVHEWTASQAYRIPIGEVDKYKRQKGKRTRHAGHYGMTFRKLAEICLIQWTEAKMVLNNFHMSNPNIQGVFQRECQHIVTDKGCMITPYGRRRDFLDRINQELFRVSYSYMPQAVVSDHQKEILMHMRELMLDIRVIVEGHDNGLVEVPEGKVGYYMEEYQKIAEKEIYFNGNCSFQRAQPIVINVDRSWSCTNWGDMKKWEN